jgi:serine/threonine protein phosphatase PrpC
MPTNLTVYGNTDVGCVRTSNEDAFVVADLSGGNLVQVGKIVRFEIGKRGVLLAVSDGMGGHQAGEVASALVIESLRRSMAKLDGTGNYDDLLEEATLKANRAVWEASSLPGREQMGATLTALFIHGTHAHIAEVGDSRAYLIRGGEVQQVTRDQSYVQFMLDTGSLTAEEAETSRLRNVILQSMGHKADVKVALGRLALRHHDAFILCSDGLSNKVSAEELAQAVLTSPRLDVACMRLIELAKQRGGEDNITAIVGGVSGDFPAQVPGERISQTLQVLQEFDALTATPAELSSKPREPAPTPG